MVPLFDRTEIQQAMRAAFPAAESHLTQYYGMQEYHLGWRDLALEPADEDPGKLLRPQLALLGCRVAGSDPRIALPLAAGIQLIHDFSLIHDDIEDQSDTRRGRLTVWKHWGLAHGINAGDGMFIVAHFALQQLRERGIAPALVLDVLQRFDQTIMTICEGQFLDLSFEGKLSISESDYLDMIRRKTSVLIGAAVGLGALVGGAATATVEALFEFGERLGLAFQIQDDVLGIWGDPEVTGKPFAADLYRRKVSLPIVYTLSQAGTTATELAELYARPDPDDAAVQRLLALLEQSAARAYTEQVAARYHTHALEALERAEGDPAALQTLQALANSLLGRSK